MNADSPFDTLKIALCICTCNRPDGLRRTLEGVAKLQFGGELRVVVVDNHPEMEGMKVCADMAPSYRFPLVCLAEPQPGISAARNTALKEALSRPADFVAMIDDDEWPEPDWLMKFLECQKDRDVPIVYGMVVARFEQPPPDWAVKGGYFADRLVPHTSSVLYSAKMLRARAAPWFDPALGLCGCEDAKFHFDLTDDGNRFALCDKAIVYESVPHGRLRAAYIMRRALKYGNSDAMLDRMRKGRTRSSFGWMMRALAKAGYGISHLFSAVLNPAKFYPAVEDFSEAAGIVLAQCGVVYFLYAGGRGLPSFGLTRSLRLSFGAHGAGAWNEAEPAAPAVRPSPAKLIVRCHDNWYDFDDSLRYLTPGGTGTCDGVSFVRDDAVRADWVGIFNLPKPAPITIHQSPNRVFFAISEPPSPGHRLLQVGQGRGTYVLTPDDTFGGANFLAPRHHLLTPCMTRSWSVKRNVEELRRHGVTGKTRRLSWVTSNLKEMEGHRYRLAFLERLRGAVEFDLYGRGFAPIDDKWDALAPYRYSIAFENFSAPYYFTEKLMDCFVAETMPIYYGSKAITEFFPADSMVVIDPQDPDVIAKIEDAVRSDLWLRRKDAILEAKSLVLEKYNIFTRIADFVRGVADEPLPAQRMRIKSVRH